MSRKLVNVVSDKVIPKVNPSSFYIRVSPNAAPCEKTLRKKRPIAVGANIQQCVWKPTKRRGRYEMLYGKPSFKAIPSTLGPKVVDSTKKSDPAYSFGRRRHQAAVGYDEGPAKFDVSGLCNKGPYHKKGIVLKSRRPELKSQTVIPGVGTYKIERGFKATNKTIPRYSFGKRHPSSKLFMTPGPNVYNLPPVVGTAKESNKKAAPAYSLIGRPKTNRLDHHVPPGPGEYEDKTTITHKNPPKYSMRRLHKIFNDDVNKPGPGAYCPERYFTHKSVPAPSFSIHYTSRLGRHKAYLIKDCEKLAKGNWLLNKMSLK